MGFESSDMARRRLAAMAMSNQRVQEALALSSAGLDLAADADLVPARGDAFEVAQVLERLVQDIADTPGAGGALLATFAEQARVLRLVAEAAERAPGRPLPSAVLEAVHAALAQAAGGPALLPS